MKESDSVFGVELNRLKRLLSVGKEESDEDSSEHTRRTASFHSLTERPGMQIGRYKLLSVLGEGGMGIVYLAQQEHPIKRRVALKVIKPGMDSARVIARFEAERQALALLEHNNIAQVYDAGMTEAGRPFFVMEYVEGLPITEHCDCHKLTIEERLHLFLQVCYAVYHAHQKGIIHRDIKPSNILVTTQEDQTVPKMIDFGVAKAVSQPLTERTLLTEQGQLFGTPEYMSPEQADTGNADIDTRSDVYSLGVLLYVLLSGCLPFDSDTLREGGVEHIRQMIRETDPKTPSTRLINLGDEAQRIAESRRTEITVLTKRLRKELEWIPLKAMQRERAERYRSASELADDVENYLKGAPLIAGPPSTMYRLKKTVRRHKAVVAGVVAVLIVSLIGTVVSLIFALGQARARAQAQGVANFLTDDLLAFADPFKLQGQKLTIQAILDNASERLEDRFGDEPLIEASIRRTLGTLYFNISKYKAAEPHLKRALQLYEEQLGEDDLNTLDCMNSLATLYYRQAWYHKAAELSARAMEISRRVHGEEHSTTRTATGELCRQYWTLGRYDEAEPLVAKSGSTGSQLYLGRGDYDKAEAIFLKGWENRRREFGEKDWRTLSSMNLIAGVWRLQGRYKEAEELLIETIDKKSEVLGEDHIYTLVSMHYLAIVYTDQGQYDKADRLFAKVLDGYIRGYEGDMEHTRITDSLNALGILRTKQGRYDDANDLFVRALKGRRNRYGEEHRKTLDSMNDLAVLRTKQKRYSEAKELFDEALEARARKCGDNHPDTLETKNDLGVLYKEQGDYDKAEPLFLEAVEGHRHKLGDMHPHTLQSWQNLINLYEVWDKPEQADQWRAKLPKFQSRP